MVEWAHENKSCGEFIHRKHKGVWVGREQNRRSKEIFWSNWNLPFPEDANNWLNSDNPVNIMSTTLMWSLLHASRSVCYCLEAYATSIAICITKHNVFKTVRALPTVWTWEARAYMTFLGLKFLRWKAWLFLVLYSHFALDLVRSLRSVSNCWEKSRKKTKNVCGQAKIKKNSVIKVTLCTS